MSSKIHPTAIIDEGAQIGDDCEIGPYVVIDKGAVIGSRNKFGPGVYVMGSVTMGDGNNVLHGASIGGGPQDINFKDPDTVLIIGNDNHIGEHATLHRGSTNRKTVIGNSNYLMGNIHVGHDCVLGDNIVMANDAKLGGFVTVQDRVILSAAAGVHQHVRIGEMTIVGAILRVTQDILPFSMVGSNDGLNGLNRIGLKRAGCAKESVSVLKEAYQRFCNKREPLGDFQQWLSGQDDPYIKKWADFVAPKSHRGYARHGGPREKGAKES